ncbi:MAG: NADH-quinone oxidoreductase subunit A [Nitrospiraceae bacterium]|nr:NADH-quinone oxidoreductase subunit A [Nitrospiraceae bacterium]
MNINYDPVPGTFMPSQYLPVLIFLMIATAFGLGALLLGELFRIRRPYAEKLMPYESGNIPVGDAHVRFSVKFYIIAMLFVVFDVEAVFLYPWALVFDSIGMYAFIEMIIFIAILLIGYVYAWRKEAFVWD